MITAAKRRRSCIVMPKVLESIPEEEQRRISSIRLRQPTIPVRRISSEVDLEHLLLLEEIQQQRSPVSTDTPPVFPRRRSSREANGKNLYDEITDDLRLWLEEKE